jgi:hypothetical protein
MEYGDSSASWTVILVGRGREYGVIVDSLRREPESCSRCHAGMVDRMRSMTMSGR